MTVQLYAYEGTTRYELDLYPEQPIKITLSAEEITTPTQVNSSFSRQFRIPATNRNAQFFKYWYTSGVIDFDVTQKVSAEIHVDGIKYTEGQLRLIAAYDNGTSDRIDFEVVFLGETKNFSSQVGDDYMNALDCTDAAHVLSLPFLENSWLDPWSTTETYTTGDYVWWVDASYSNQTMGDTYVATATNTNSEPSLTNSNWQRLTTTARVGSPIPVRYILADRGYTYTDAGAQEPVPGQTNASEVSVDNSACQGCSETHNTAFTRNVHPLFITQFTPIIQVKYLIDKIFELTTYDYTTDSIFNEEWFQKLYVDGVAVGLPYVPNSDGLSTATTLYYTPVENFTPVEFDTVLQNNANAYNNTTYTYTIPVTGTYTFEANVEGRAQNDNDLGQPSPYAECGIYKNGSSIAQATTQTGSGGLLNFSFNESELTYTATFNTGDEVNVILSCFETDYPANVLTGQFACTLTPAQIAVNDLLKADLKIMDFLKSILTKFRMVMVPTVNNPNLFIVKPWEDYIATGDTFDWTEKLDRNKDIKMEPLFYEQASSITFIDQEDIDKTNKYNQDTFGQPFGTRRFNSNNELLSNTNEVTTEFAPTPVSQIEGLGGTGSNFIIPKLFEVGDESTDTGHDHPQHQPIVPVQRLLFWNGLAPTTSFGNQDITWHYTDGNTTKDSSDAPLVDNGVDRYPRASYLSEIPTIGTTLNLNWEKKFGYFAGNGGPASENGESVYDRYWRTYINNIYSSKARKMTAYFNLDSEDMRKLTFDDLIWIKDAYWRIQKVYDAPLGEIATIKVELIKILQYVAPISGNGAALPSDPVDQGGGTPLDTGTESETGGGESQTGGGETPVDGGGSETPVATTRYFKVAECGDLDSGPYYNVSYSGSYNIRLQTWPYDGGDLTTFEYQVAKGDAYNGYGSYICDGDPNLFTTYANGNTVANSMIIVSEYETTVAVNGVITAGYYDCADASLRTEEERLF